MERGTESETAIFWVETLVFFWNALLKFFELFTCPFQRNPNLKRTFHLFIFSTFLLVSKSMLNVGLWVFSYAFHGSSSFGWPVLEALVDFTQRQQRLRGPVRGLGVGWIGWMVDRHKPGVLKGNGSRVCPKIRGRCEPGSIALICFD